MDKSEQLSNLIDEKMLYDEVLSVDGTKKQNYETQKIAKEYETGVDYEMQLRFHNHNKKSKES